MRAGRPHKPCPGCGASHPWAHPRDADDVTNQTCRRARLGNADQIDPTALGQVLDVDQVHTSLAKVRLKQLNSRQTQQRRHQLLRTRPTDSQGHGLNAFLTQSRKQRFNPSRSKSANGGFILRQVELQSTSIHRTADFAVLQVSHDRFARFDRNRRLRLHPSARPSAASAPHFHN